MGIKKSPRPWFCFSSSSGATFQALYRALPEEDRLSLKGFFTDRQCGALDIARKELTDVPVLMFPRKKFEEDFLAWKKAHPEEGVMILLCGFFGILSGDFLEAVGAPLVNTHPSLLPAFPGKDEKVHALAAQSVAISGFTVHLINEQLDGGPILFQHPVYLQSEWDAETARREIRKEEQTWLPRVWTRLLRSSLRAEDRHKTTRYVREHLSLSLSSFESRKDFEA